MLFTFAEYFLQINFISLDALLRNSEQIKPGINFVRVHANGRSLYTVDRRMLVVEWGNVLHHVKREKLSSRKCPGEYFRGDVRMPMRRRTANVKAAFQVVTLQEVLFPGHHVIGKNERCLVVSAAIRLVAV